MKKTYYLLHIILFFSSMLMCSNLFSQNQLAQIDSAFYYYQKSENYSNNNKPFLEYKYFLKSKNIYQALHLLDSVANCNLKLFQVLSSQNNLKSNPLPFLDAYYQYAVLKKDTLKIISSYYNYANYYHNTDKKNTSASYYKRVLLITKKTKTKANVYSNLGLLYTKKDKDSANYFFQKSLRLYDKIHTTELFSTHINYANFFQKQQKFLEAILELDEASKITPAKYKKKLNKILYLKFAECYKEVHNYNKAYFYLNKYNLIKDSLNNTAQNIAISNLDKKYKTAEKDKQILIEKQKTKKQKALLLATLLFLISGGIIAYLLLKNSKKKRILAQQAQEISKQKNLTLIKEQEITTINAMVEGQEKERKRVAEDLHDNIGSVLATLKLHFDNLQINREKKRFNQDELFLKTEKLIDEAYLKVRSIAHAKNAGVIANQGLLVAIQMMSEKITSANNLQIEVIHFGLDKRIDNSLEITVFRIIQELITNILKHAEAKNATINISQYDNQLHIIVEDDGKGFHFKNIELKNGMGLNSIKTRVLHLKGVFTIDATPKKGCTIIFTIPIT